MKFLFEYYYTCILKQNANIKNILLTKYEVRAIDNEKIEK